ncbi:FAD-binding oxidoreductase [Occultella glacieicola]|uniref:FAD-binding oxidoreductase n=1 Tax=Occultella glacieicola TaxID=2518684 RepID=UPI001404309D|nr:FAD-binding oxidoreductase [Occultella glacieicola]
MTTLSESDVTSLRSTVSGTVLLRGEPGFADAVRGQNLAVTHDPDLAVSAASEEDVSAAVAFAAAHGLPVDVLATGHGSHVPVTSGLQLLTHELNAVSVDPAARLVTIGAGARWAAVIEKTAPLGLAPVTGSSTHVGVVGYTLGGGLGPLARSHGFSTDWVRALRVVTGDGSLLTASATQNPDLFWALRGGKYGLGVVTEITIEVAEVPALYAGNLMFDEEYREQVLRGWVDWLPTASGEVNTSVALITMPPLPFIPEHLRGKRVLSLRFAYAGPAADGERLAAPLRALAPALTDELGELPLAQVARIHADPEEPGSSWSGGTLLRRLDQDFVDVLLSTAAAPGSPIMVVELRHLGAATAVDVPEGSATAGRGAIAAVSVVAAGPPPALGAAATAFEEFKGALTPWLAEHETVSFGNVGSAESYRALWPADVYERLAGVRASVDPDGVLSPAWLRSA